MLSIAVVVALSFLMQWPDLSAWLSIFNSLHTGTAHKKKKWKKIPHVLSNTYMCINAKNGNEHLQGSTTNFGPTLLDHKGLLYVAEALVYVEFPTKVDNFFGTFWLL
jgi:hypothetical protein